MPRTEKIYLETCIELDQLLEDYITHNIIIISIAKRGHCTYSVIRNFSKGCDYANLSRILTSDVQIPFCIHSNCGRNSRCRLGVAELPAIL